MPYNAHIMSTSMRAIFWDMDGTLVDSEPLWEIATFELSERLGKRITPEQREQTMGGSFLNTLRICAEHAGVEVTEELIASEFSFMCHRMVELLSKELEPFAGVRELLTQLKERGIKSYITTNTPRIIADGAIDGIGRDLFAGSVCGDEVEHPKPAPDIYVRAAQLAGIAPQDCLVFEDSPTGMRAAVAAGCRVIGLPAHKDIAVPEGVQLFTDLAGQKPFNHSYIGLGVEDLYRWFNSFSS